MQPAEMPSDQEPPTPPRVSKSKAKNDRKKANQALNSAQQLGEKRRYGGREKKKYQGKLRRPVNPVDNGAPGRAAEFYFIIFKAFLNEYAQEEDEGAVDELYTCLVDGITKKGFLSFLELLKQTILDPEVNLDHHRAFIANPGKVYELLMRKVIRDGAHLPFFEVFTAYRAELKTAKAILHGWNDHGKEATKTVFAVVIDDEDIKIREAIKGFRAWAMPTKDNIRERPKIFRSDLISTIIDPLPPQPRPPHYGHPTTDIFLSRTSLQRLSLISDRLDWLLDPSRDDNIELSTEEIVRLDLPTVHQADAKKLFIFSRIDDSWALRAEDESLQLLAKSFVRRGQEAIAVSLLCRVHWQRLGTRNAAGEATGAGNVVSQDGKIGPYRNTKQSFRAQVKEDQEKLRALNAGEDHVLDHLIGLVSGVFPGHYQDLLRESIKSNLPRRGCVRLATTIALMQGFDSPLHVEPPKDATLTFAISYGAPDPSSTPVGAYNFSLAAHDGGRGWIIENGAGVVMVFRGDVYLHGTSFQWEGPLTETNNYDDSDLADETVDVEEEGEEEEIRCEAALDVDFDDWEKEERMDPKTMLKASIKAGEGIAKLGMTLRSRGMSLRSSREEGIATPQVDSGEPLRLRGGGARNDRRVPVAGQPLGECEFQKLSMLERKERKDARVAAENLGQLGGTALKNVGGRLGDSKKRRGAVGVEFQTRRTTRSMSRRQEA